jgi:hypothetical protein
MVNRCGYAFFEWFLMAIEVRIFKQKVMGPFHRRKIRKCNCRSVNIRRVLYRGRSFGWLDFQKVAQTELQDFTHDSVGPNGCTN